MAIYKGTDLLAGVVTTVDKSERIGQIIQSTIPLTDAGLHPLDGSTISKGGIYDAFVDYISNLDLSADCFCTAEEWTASVAAYGSCGKFVYDNINDEVILPKRTTEHGQLIKSWSSGTEWYRIYEDGWCEQGGIQASTSVFTVNLYKEYLDTNYSVQGTHYKGDATAQFRWIDIATKTTSSFTFGAAYSQTAATGNGNITWQTCGYIDISNYQQSAIYEYIVMATSTKTDIEVDIDEVVTDLNGKADTSLTNINISCQPIDGQWINYSTSLVTNVSWAGGTTRTFDLSSYLPNDGHIYEILVCAAIQTGASTGNFAGLSAYSSVVGSSEVAIPICRTCTRTSSIMVTSGSITIPIGTDRILYGANVHSSAITASLWIAGYRRVGTNS